MKNRDKKGLIIGAIGGAVLFTLFGLLPGSFLGGVIGLNIAKGLFGSPVNADLAPRLIVATAMVVGVFVVGIVTVIATSLLGMVGANVVSALRVDRKCDIKVALKGQNP
jgi:hypothetical protein